MGSIAVLFGKQWYATTQNTTTPQRDMMIVTHSSPAVTSEVCVRFPNVKFNKVPWAHGLELSARAIPEGRERLATRCILTRRTKPQKRNVKV